MGDYGLWVWGGRDCMVCLKRKKHFSTVPYSDPFPYALQVARSWLVWGFSGWGQIYNIGAEILPRILFLRVCATTLLLGRAFDILYFPLLGLIYSLAPNVLIFILHVIRGHTIRLV